MSSLRVAVFGRVKPTPKKTQNQELCVRYGENEDYMCFDSTKISAGRKYYRFKKIFGENATQDEVFEHVAKPVIQKVLSGYNGTIFTYGPTGTGKTYTMTGDIEKRINLGLIPRTIQELFRTKTGNTAVTITYCEIYNEHVYDLIRMENVDSELPRVNIMEDASGITHFRNLSVHTVTTAYEAMELLLRGDANKMVSETVNNPRSSRSHVIFSISLDIPHPKGEIVCWKPVLYLVDLAGSERLNRGKTPSNNPYETRYINLSLHYLEQVLLALRQPGRAHIPYRNSLITALLRNSLGGNCFTSMIATFTLSPDDVGETHQTCRFAERIGLIKNDVKLTETSDPQVEIDFLKKENEKLRTQLSLIGKEQIAAALSEEEKTMCSELLDNYIQSNNALDLPLLDIRKTEYCFSLMRELLQEQKFHQKEENLQGKSFKDPIEKYFPPQKKWSDLETPNKNMARKSENSVEKNWRRKRYPMDLPKVNITYKRWKSTELLSENETSESKEIPVRESSSNENDCENVKPTKSVKQQRPVHSQNTPVSQPKPANNKPEYPTEVKNEKLEISNFDQTNAGKGLKGDKDADWDTKTLRKWSSNKTISLDPKSEDTFILSDRFQNIETSEVLPQVQQAAQTPSVTKSIVLETQEKIPVQSSNSRVDMSIDDQDSMLCMVTESQKSLHDSIPFEMFKKLTAIGVQMEADREIEMAKEVEFWESRTIDEMSVVSARSSQFSLGRLPLTGDVEVDEEIMKFYRSRFEVLRQEQ